MKLSSLNNFLNKSLLIEDFKKEIAKEIAEYKRSLKERGRSAVIHLQNDIQDIKVSTESVNFLCSLFISEQINNWEMNYIIEALLLSENVSFERDMVKTSLEELSDPEYGLKLTKAYVTQILNSFN